MNDFMKFGFKVPQVIENDYGIKVYIGSENNNNWALFIPPELLILKYPDAIDWALNGMTHFDVTKGFCLYKVKEWEEFMKSYERKKVV